MENQNYWDIDTILAEEEMVLTQFQVDANGLGFLEQGKNDGGKSEKALVAGTRVELPYYMATSLYENDIVELQPPRVLQKSNVEGLRSSPEVLNFNLKAPYIYEVASRLVEIMPKQYTHEVYPVVIQALMTRAKLIHDQSQDRNLDKNIIQQETAFLQKLSVSEKKQFQRLKRAFAEFTEWKERKKQPLVSINTDLLLQPKKRIKL